MVLLQPASIAVPSDDGRSLDDAWLDGAFTADGWVERNGDGVARARVSFAGLDGGPKEATKTRIAALMAARGVSTHWSRKQLDVNDRALMERFAPFGHRAFNKRFPTLNYTRANIEAVLDGLRLDASRNTSSGWTYNTTSRELAVQIRTLLRMVGRRSGFRCVVDHGGLGTHPIYRIGEGASAKAEKLLRVREVVKFGEPLPVWDIRTDDHYVYLPEHDVTVSNCDDFTTLLGAMHRLLGFESLRARVVSIDAQYWEHVFLLVGFPKRNGAKWMPLDPTVRGSVPGWQYQKIKSIQDFTL
jgi:hypothetical protein